MIYSLAFKKQLSTELINQKYLFKIELNKKK